MLSYEPELEQLRPILGDTNTNELIARERREAFSLHPELRVLSWGGALLLATAAGLVLKNNLDRIGPLALAVSMAIAAAACYAFVWWHRARASIVDDYILLLGALLFSGDVAFIETQFHLLGDAWHRHFLIVAIVHGVTAYVFRSRLVLSLSITAIAAWLGVRESPFTSEGDYAVRAFACSLLLLTWRAAHQRFDPHRDARDFAPSFEHFAANIAFAGAMVLMFDNDTDVIGCLVMLIIAAMVTVWGIRVRGEMFVLYAFLYAVLAINVLVYELLHDKGWMFLFVPASMVGAIIGLLAIHARVKEWRS